MSIAVSLVGALLVPFAALALLLWLCHLEESLDRDVEARRRRPDPPPILALPLSRDRHEVAG